MRGQRLRDLSRALPRPETLLDAARQRLDWSSERLPAALVRGVQTRRLALTEAAGSLRPGMLRARATEGARSVAQWSARLAPAHLRLVEARRERLGRVSDRLGGRAIRAEIGQGAERLANLSRRLDAVFAEGTRTQRSRLDALDRLRETLGYRETLRTRLRGRAGRRTCGDDGKAAAEAASGLEIEFHDGRLRLGGGSGPKKAAQKGKAPEQGSLF